MSRLLRCAVLLAPALAWAAQDPPPGKAPTAPGAPVSIVGMTPDAAAQIPDSRKMEIADQSLKTIRKTSDRVAGRSDQARIERDIGKLNCLNAQLTQIKGLARVATQANEALVDAVSKKDAATANTQFARVAIATEKVVRMGGEADICLGQLAFLVDGQTSVQVEQPEGLPGMDVTKRAPPAPPLHAPPIVRPLSASRTY
jgi:hypothetical protein